jgi:hypothetical protein
MIRSTRDLGRWLAYEIWDHNIDQEPQCKLRRQQPARDWEYRAWIRTLPCTACGSTRYVEAAHTGSDGGMSQKASDYSCIPLCALCHRVRGDSYHSLGRQEFERRRGVDCIGLSAELYAIWSDRRPKTRSSANKGA